MSIRATQQLVRVSLATPLSSVRGLSLPSISGKLSFFHTRTFVDVRACASTTEAAPTAPDSPPEPQQADSPRAVDSSDPDDEVVIAEFITSISKCKNGIQLQKLVDGKDFNSKTGALELGHVIRKLRQIDDEAKVPWGQQGTSVQFARRLCYETRNSMYNMLPRTIANCLFQLQGLAALDKLLLAKAATVATKRVDEDPTTFKVTEIAQICRACARLQFFNKKLNRALSANILSLSDAELNPRAVLNILSASNRMGFSNPEVFRCLLTHLIKNVGMLEVYYLGRVTPPVARLMKGCPAESTALLNALQYTINRQKPHAINAMSAGIMLKDLASAGVLQPEAAHTLISIVQREEQIGQSLSAVLQQAAPALDKLGYQVNVQSSFSDLDGQKKSGKEAVSTPVSGSTPVEA